jgi:hypothetical protein
VGLAWIQSRDAEAEEQVLTRQLPEGTAPEPGEQAVDTALAATSAQPGKVILDLGQGEVIVKPAQPGEPIRVEASFDPDDCRLEESFEEGDGSGWTYTVKFRRVASAGILTSIKEAFAGTGPRIHVYLPVGVPLDLDLSIRQGGGAVDLGGLWLTNADIRLEMGGGKIDFSEPLPYPMESLTISASMGGGAFQHIGNASPGKLTWEIKMGGGDLDLRGAWRQDSDIRLDVSMGGGRVVLPQKVRIEGLETLVTRKPLQEEEVPLPTLRFQPGESMGNLEFVN